MKKNIFLFLFLTIVFSNVFAQENSGKVKEVGLVFSNLNSFGIRYKCGNEKSLFRITALTINGSDMNSSSSANSLNGNSTNTSTNPANSLSLGLNFGFEIRKHISEKIFLFYGIDWINTFSGTCSYCQCGTYCAGSSPRGQTNDSQ